MTAGSEPFVVPGGDHRQLLTKGQDLQMEEAATTEQASQSKDQRGEERLHREEATVREEKTSTGSVSTTFLVGTPGEAADTAPVFQPINREVRWLPECRGLYELPVAA